MKNRKGGRGVKKLKRRRIVLSAIILVMILLLSAIVFIKDKPREASLNEETIILDKDKRVVPPTNKSSDDLGH